MGGHHDCFSYIMWDEFTIIHTPTTALGISDPKPISAELCFTPGPLGPSEMHMELEVFFSRKHSRICPAHICQESPGLPGLTWHDVWLPFNLARLPLWSPWSHGRLPAACLQVVPEDLREPVPEDQEQGSERELFFSWNFGQNLGKNQLGCLCFQLPSVSIYCSYFSPSSKSSVTESPT